QARGNSGSRDDRLTFSCQCHLGEQLHGEKGDIDQGFLDWEEYQRSLLEDVYCHNFLVRPTGLLRRLYEDVTDLDYKASHFYGLTEHPIHGDMPYLGVDYLTSQSYFRFFIRRMFHTDEAELAGSISEA
ncbi:hypothetical protein ACV1DV_10985, partial [Aeromonas veronii]